MDFFIVSSFKHAQLTKYLITQIVFKGRSWLVVREVTVKKLSKKSNISGMSKPTENLNIKNLNDFDTFGNTKSLR